MYLTNRKMYPHFIFKCAPLSATGGLYYETFYDRNLRILVIS